MLTEKGLVSIIIPCYNGEQYIEETIQSIIAQTYDNWEILFIDDGSTDSTATLVKKMAKTDAIINYFHQVNQGVSKSRNRGIKEATGEYLVFFDADDLMTKDFLEKRIGLLESNPSVDFCCSDVLTFPGERRLTGAIKDIPREFFVDRINIVSCPSNYLFRRKALLATNVVFNGLLYNAADRLFLMEISKYLKGGYITQGGELYYRVHEKSMSSRVNSKIVLDTIKFIDLIKSQHLIPTEYTSVALVNMYIIIGKIALSASKYLIAAKYLVKSFFVNPIYFIRRLIQVSFKKIEILKA